MTNSPAPDKAGRGGRHGRNDPCPCGSGRKYKACCGAAASGAGSNLARTIPIGGPAAQAALARAVAAREAGRPAEAAALLKQALARDPTQPTLWVELGAQLQSAGRPAEALPCFEQALLIQPTSVAALVGRGSALEQLGWHTEAAEAYRQALVLKPRQAEVHARLATTMLIQDRRSEAARSFQRAAGLANRPAAAALYSAYALSAQGRGDEALGALRRAVTLEPGNAAAQAELGKLLAESGDSVGASQAFRQCLALSPRAAGHWYDLVRIRRLDEADRPMLDSMLTLSAREDLHVLHRIMLELAIGKAYADLDDPEQSMAHIMASNRLKGQVRPLDRDLIAKRVDWMISAFTPELIARFADAGSSDATPLLVLGVPRSGTTLVESVLACHSSVGAGQELSFWNRCGREIVASGALPEPAALATIARNYLAVLRGLSDRPHVTDKKPDNFFWAGLVLLVFPQARIVHCRRDPLDTCVSILANFFAPRPDFSTEPGDLVFYFRQYERLMSHWRAVLPPRRFMEIDYERLVERPEAVVPELLEFCGLQWEEACLHPERNRRRVSTASLWQVRRPIFTGSVGRWRRVEPWLAELGVLRQTARPGDPEETQGVDSGHAAANPGG